MKILLLGATGRTGKLVLQEALKKELEVNCLVRNSEKIVPHSNLFIYEGNPNKKEDLEKAIQDCECIISILNISRTSDFPWAKLRTPKKYLSEVMEKVISISQEKNIKQVVVCSAWGVAETKHDIPKWFKWFIDNSNIGVAYKDHERQEALLLNSQLDYTIIRPVGLTNSKRKERVRETFKNSPEPSLTISRLSVATYMIESIFNIDLFKKVVTISKD